MPYQTKNSCSRAPSLLCILTIVLYIALITLHFVYIFSTIISGQITYIPVLYVMLGLHFILFLVILYDYIWILVHDPVDTVVYDQQLAEKIAPEKLIFCTICGHRLVGSYHCKQCGRCTQEFDHHCGKNYEKFFRLLITNVFWHINLIGQGIWVFIAAHDRKQIRTLIPESYWVIIGIICLSGAILIIICFLMFFHCYLSCCLGFTTLHYIIHGNTRPKKNINIKIQNRDKGPESQRQLY